MEPRPNSGENAADEYTQKNEQIRVKPPSKWLMVAGGLGLVVMGIIVHVKQADKVRDFQHVPSPSHMPKVQPGQPPKHERAVPASYHGNEIKNLAETQTSWLNIIRNGKGRGREI